MQTIKKLILFSLMVVVAYAALAQPHGSKHEEKWEKYRAEKIAFFNSRTGTDTSRSSKILAGLQPAGKRTVESSKISPGDGGKSFGSRRIDVGRKNQTAYQGILPAA